MSSCLSKVRQVQNIAMQGDFSTNNFITHQKIIFNPSKGVFIATQLNSTRRRVELCRYKHPLSCEVSNRCE